MYLLIHEPPWSCLCLKNDHRRADSEHFKDRRRQMKDASRVGTARTRAFLLQHLSNR